MVLKLRSVSGSPGELNKKVLGLVPPVKVKNGLYTWQKQQDNFIRSIASRGEEF